MFLYLTGMKICFPHLQVLPVKRQRPADQCVQDDAQTPDVHLRAVILLPLEKLRSGVRWGPTEGVQFIAFGELVAEAEVRYLDVGVGVEQQVLCLRDAKRRRSVQQIVLENIGTLLQECNNLWVLMKHTFRSL